MQLEDIDRVMEIVQRLVVRENRCIEWTGKCDRCGYGYVQYNGRSRQVHKVIYEFLHGPVPRGLVLDHIKCDNPKCANDEHVKPITNKENVLRGIGFTAMKARQTECIRGHPLSGDNLYMRLDGHRACKICKRECLRRYRASRLAEV